MSSSSGLRAPSQSSTHSRKNRSVPYSSSGRSKQRIRYQHKIPTGILTPPRTESVQLTAAENVVITLGRYCVLLAFFDTFSFHSGTQAIENLSRLYMSHILTHSGVRGQVDWNEHNTPDYILATITSKVQSSIDLIHQDIMDVVHGFCVQRTSPVHRQDMKKAYLSKHVQPTCTYERSHGSSDQVTLSDDTQRPNLHIDFVTHCSLQHDTVGIAPETNDSGLPSLKKQSRGPDEYVWFSGIVPQEITVIVKTEMDKIFKQWKKARAVQTNVTDEVFLDEADNIRCSPEFSSRFVSASGTVPKSFRHWRANGFQIPWEISALTQELGITALQCLVPDPLAASNSSNIMGGPNTHLSALGVPTLQSRTDAYHEILRSFKNLPALIRNNYQDTMKRAINSQPHVISTSRLISASKSGWSSPVNAETRKTMKQFKEVKMTERERYYATVNTMENVNGPSQTVNSSDDNGEDYLEKWKSLLVSSLVMGFGGYVAETLNILINSLNTNDSDFGNPMAIYFSLESYRALAQAAVPHALSDLRHDQDTKHTIVALSSFLKSRSPQSAYVITDFEVQNDIYLDLVPYDSNFFDL